MKRTGLVATAVLITTGCFAQSIFPTDGSNVGIGTTNPSEKLEVSGNIVVRQATSTNILIEGTGAANYAGGALLLKSGDVQPNNKFNQITLVTDRGADGAAVFGIQRRLNNDYYGQLSNYSDANGWRFYTASDGTAITTTPMFVIQPNGNVGIGTTTPSEKLTVEGDNQSVAVSSEVFNFSTQSPLGAKFGMWNDASTNAAGIKFYRWLGSGTLFHTAYIGQAAASPNNGDYGLDFRTNAVSSLTDATTSRMFISSINGNVGIGTTSPSALLDVRGNVNIGADTRIVGEVFAGHGLRVNSSTGDNVNNAPWFGLGTSNLTIGGAQNIVQLAGFYGLNIQTANGQMVMNQSGNVGIGTANPGSYKLAVEGTIGARKMVVTQASWADYVFEPSYQLPSLDSVEAFVKVNKHLPEVPSAKQVKEEGVDLGGNQAVLLKKIEELTLYMIEMKKENQQLKERLDKMETAQTSNNPIK